MKFDIQIMSASEAKKLSNEKQTMRLAEAREKVRNEIQKAVNAGDYDVTLSYHLRDEIKKELEQLGYKVKRDTYNIYNNITTISWEE